MGGTEVHRNPSHEIGQVWDYKGYLVFIIALDCINLNLYDYIDNWSSISIFQAYTGDLTIYKVGERSDIHRMFLNIPGHNVVNLHVIV